MNAKPYPKYKPSGVEWLGDVPEHWAVKGASKGFEIQLGKMLQPDAAHKDDFEVPYLKSQHVQWERVRIEESPRMWASLRDVSKYGVKDGDLLVCEGGDVGRAAIVRNPESQTIIQNALHRVRPSDGNDVRFLMRVLEHAAAQDWFSILCNRSTIAHFTSEKFGSLLVPVPPPMEQQFIADFLDERTGKLDGLLGKKRELIAKLKEKRSALISRTVTKGLPPEAAAKAGLPPNPNLKPSGIEWLGDIPEHWEVKKLSWLFSYGKGREAATLTKEYVGSNPGEYPVYSGQTANNGLMGEIDTFEFDFKAPVILVTTVGAKAMTTRLVGGKLSLSQNCALIIPRSKQLSAYFYEAVLQTLFDFEKGSISLIMQPSLRFEDLDRFHVPLMPSDEQAGITEFLMTETSKIDRMIQKVETAIEKLTEYRTALITAAVTGKIDVRDQN